ncbi:MAG: hypothetical protein AABX50_01730 [Nanoarchaeota archaeon]
MASIWVYIAVIALGVVLAFYGVKHGKWLTFFAGLVIAIASTYTAGII